MPRFSLTPPERSQWPHNCLLKQPDMKSRVYKVRINYALWRSRHPTPNPCTPGLIPLLCLASLSTRLGTTEPFLRACGAFSRAATVWPPSVHVQGRLFALAARTWSWL